MSRFRYLKNAASEMKKADPQCAITERALREWVAAGILPALSVGCRKLVDLDTVEKLISEPIQPQEKDQEKIRRVG